MRPMRCKANVNHGALCITDLSPVADIGPGGCIGWCSRLPARMTLQRHRPVDSMQGPGQLEEGLDDSYYGSRPPVQKQPLSYAASLPVVEHDNLPSDTCRHHLKALHTCASFRRSGEHLAAEMSQAPTSSTDVESDRIPPRDALANEAKSDPILVRLSWARGLRFWMVDTV